MPAIKLSNFKIPIKKVVTAVMLLTFLQACSTHAEYRTEYVGVKQRWDKDHKAKEENVTNIEFVDFRVVRDYLNFKKRTHYILQEYEFERYEKYERMHYGGDVVLLFIPLYGLIICMADIKNCFGYTGDWTDYEEIDENVRLSGNIENKTYQGFPDDTSVSWVLSGESEVGNSYKHVGEYREIYYGSINIKKIVQDWIERPVKLRVDFEASYEGSVYRSAYEFSADELASFSLESDAWNSPEENKHKYFYELTSALRAGKHDAALVAFHKLESMDFEKPESFWYRYAITAQRARKILLAIEKAEKYLQVAKKRVYAKQAQALIAEESR